jgi:integral membrane sensor domain MASE1
MTGMPENQKQKLLIAILILAFVYLTAGKVGLITAIVHPGAASAWLPAGIALAALLVFGYDLWPGVWLGGFVVSLTTTGSAAACVGVASGNTLEALAAAYLVNKFTNGRKVTESTKDIFKLEIKRVQELFSSRL